MKGRILPIPGSDLPEVTDAMSFLRTVSYDKIPEHFPVGAAWWWSVVVQSRDRRVPVIDPKLGAKDVWMVAIEPGGSAPRVRQ